MTFRICSIRVVICDIGVLHYYILKMLRRILMEMDVEEEDVRIYKPRINFEDILPTQFTEYFRISSTQCEYVLGKYKS